MAILVHALILFCLLVLMYNVDAYEFVVGGQKGWSVPNANLYNQWAEKSRFQVGDSLVFNYKSDKDSVIEVNSKQDYENCNTNASSEKFSDGHTVIKLTKSGPHFFISGNKYNCLNNEKLLVIVLADRTNTNQTTTSTTPSPSPYPSVSGSGSVSPPLSEHSSDALAPSPPSPSLQVADSSPPPLGTDVINPNPITPAPVTEPLPPNAASSILIGFVGSVGALTVLLLV